MPFGLQAPVHRALRLAFLTGAAAAWTATAQAQVVVGGFGGSSAPSNLQQQPSATSPPTITEHLQGVVVSSVDGKPVPRVLVTTAGDDFAALTDFEGRFSFNLRRLSSPENTPAVPLQFNVKKPGYVTRTVTTAVAADTSSSPAAPGLSSGAPVQLTIIPAALITGHIDTASGRLPGGVEVQLRRKQVSNGAALYYPMATMQPSPSRDFRFPELSPGDYKLSAYQTVSDSHPDSPGQQTPDAVPGLLPVFYPESRSLEDAAVLHVAPGATVVANLNLRASTFYRVTIPIAASAEPISPAVFLTPDATGVSLLYDPRLHAVRGLLPPGTYTVLLNDASRGFRPIPNPPPVPERVRLTTPQPPLTASLTLHVDAAPVRTDPVTLHPAGEVHILLRRDLTESPDASTTGRAPSPAPVIVMLSDVNNTTGFGSSFISTRGPEDDELVIPGVHEGAYRVQTRCAACYAASITSGGADLLRDPLVVDASGSPPPIEITLRNDGANVRVHIQTGAIQTGTVAAPATLGPRVAEVSAFPLDNPAQVATAYLRLDAAGLQNSPAASASFTDLAPGRYLIVAAENSADSLQQIDYLDPAVLQSLLSKGVVVTLAAAQNAEINVPLLPVPAEAD